MTQRIFDRDNTEDMDLLLSILPDRIERIEKKNNNDEVLLTYDNGYIDEIDIFKINWHDKTEITRPIQEATEADVGKLCVFWDNDNEADGQFFGIFRRKTLQGKYICDFKGWIFHHCRRLTKEEVSELC